TGVVYGGNGGVGLALGAFDVFEAVTRVLPGAWVTAGIDLIVGIITALGVGSISVAAKVAEKIMAVFLFVGAAAVVGGVAALASRRARPWAPAAAGACLGVVGHVAAEVALRRFNLADAAWTAVVFAGGATLLARSLTALQGSANADLMARRRFVARVVTTSVAASTLLVVIGAL